MQIMTWQFVKSFKRNLIKGCQQIRLKVHRNAICKDVTNPCPTDLEESQNYGQYCSNLEGEQT